MEKICDLGDRLMGKQMGMIKKLEMGIVSFLPILTTLGVHFLTERESILRTLQFCLSCGRYSPFYLCCSLVVTSDLPEDIDPKLITANGTEEPGRTMLPGIRYGYRPDGITEVDFMVGVIEEAKAMIGRLPPNAIFNHVNGVENQVPIDIDTQWNDSMDMEAAGIKEEFGKKSDHSNKNMSTKNTQIKL
eukprot:gnl/Chilomastix_caulleri/1502.p1 GENE.gnl/Chilomastix_caulleri/1502~~gnl/Chilomastix_caulleri/1502.p1  ORF type:complete len:189 (+),score=39.11 gnl/Chilomastix_caulleri/1502:394-960(+)